MSASKNTRVLKITCLEPCQTSITVKEEGAALINKSDTNQKLNMAESALSNSLDRSPLGPGGSGSVIVRAKAAVRKFKLFDMCVPSADETEASPACKTTGCCSEGPAPCQVNLRRFQNIGSARLL